jgi:hypothetical protein
MTVTTLPDLIARAESLARDLRFSDEPTTTEQWTTFEATTHRLMRELANPLLVGRRLSDTTASRPREIARNLPRAPQFAAPETRYTVREAATQLGVGVDTVLGRLHRSELPGVLDTGAYVIRAADLFDTADIVPASAASTHPLDRLSTMLGATADLITLHRQRQGFGVQDDPLGSDGQLSPVMARLLTVTLVAARDSVSRLPLAAADHALELAKYAERSLDQLSQRVESDSLSRVASFIAEPKRPGHHDELQSALRSWTESAHAEVSRGIPSADSLRAIANQSLHIYAVTARMLGPSQAGAVEHHEAQECLREAAVRQRRLQEQWGNVTTAVKPRRELASATRNVHGVLERFDERLVDAGSECDLTAGERNAACNELANALGEIADITHEARHLPDLLARSDLLFAPARILPSVAERLQARQLGRFVPVIRKEAQDLRSAAHDAADAAATAVRTVTPELQMPHRRWTSAPAVTTSLGTAPAL